MDGCPATSSVGSEASLRIETMRNSPPRRVNHMPNGPIRQCRVSLEAAGYADRAEVRRGSYAELAASLSLQLMKIGVRAVVAAGWEVVDQPASTFAETFYSRMVAGTVFGESVGAAREIVL